MHQILYVSAAHSSVGPAEVDRILAKARQRNAELGVTGLLLVIEQSFLQLLEGEKGVLEDLMARIGRDPRHTRVLRLLEREVPARQLPSWSMGYFRPASEAEMPDAFRITRATIEARLGALRSDDPARLIDVFCSVNGVNLGAARAA